LKKLIPILAFVFFTFFSLNAKAQAKENAIIYLYEVLQHGFKIKTFINNEMVKEEEFPKVSSTLVLLELHKHINKLNEEGWRIVSTDTYKSRRNNAHRIVYLERDKK
jgi:hypothetical protein